MDLKLIILDLMQDDLPLSGTVNALLLESTATGHENLVKHNTENEFTSHPTQIAGMGGRLQECRDFLNLSYI